MATGQLSIRIAIGVAFVGVFVVTGCGDDTDLRSDRAADENVPLSPPATAVATATSSTFSASTASDLASDSDELAPLCDDREAPDWVADASHAGDGVADPAGRIFFGQFVRQDDVIGQIIGPLFAVDADGSDVAQVLDCQIARPRVSPDGTRLVFSIFMEDHTWQVATSSADGSDLRIITSGPGFSETPDWAPDGTWLIYSHMACPTEDWDWCVGDDGDGWALWRMGVDGSNPQLVGEPGGYDWEPRLSPDGGSVVFTRMNLQPGSDYKLWIVVRDLATGEERSVEHPELSLEHPDWSPDGEWIVYNTWDFEGCTKCERVERIPADDLQAEPDVLYPAEPGGMKPTYSPDGLMITFGCSTQLCVMGANGEQPTVLIEIPGQLVNHFAWGDPVAAPP